MPDKRISFLMTRDDEVEFTRRLRAAIPTVQFFSENASHNPVRLAGIEVATTGVVRICNGGPASGPVSWAALPPAIRFHKSARRDSPIEALRGATLQSGEMTVHFADEDHETRRLAVQVWRVLRGMTTNKVQRINPASDAVDLGEVRDVHVAAHAIEWQREGGLLASTSANIYFRAYGKIPEVKKRR